MALALLSTVVISNQAFADDDPYTLAPVYVGAMLSYNKTADANPTLNRDKQPLGFGALIGYKRPLDDYAQLFWGFEFQFNSLGSDKWASNGGAEPSANYYQLNGLTVLHYMPVPHMDLKLKAGLAWQFIQANNMGDNTNWFALPVVGAGVGVYVSSRIELAANWLYTFGEGDGKAAHGSHDTIANNQFSVSINYHF